MVVRNEAHRLLLLARAEEDRHVRAELARDGSLFSGYRPRMEAVHLSNAHALSELLADGWPKAAGVGEDGQEAAWLIAQHAISFPQFQRRSRELLHEAVQRGEGHLHGSSPCSLTASVCSKGDLRSMELNSTGTRTVRSLRCRSKMRRGLISDVARSVSKRSSQRCSAIGGTLRRAVSVRRRIEIDIWQNRRFG